MYRAITWKQSHQRAHQTQWSIQNGTEPSQRKDRDWNVFGMGDWFDESIDRESGKCKGNVRELKQAEEQIIKTAQ